jgi:hypothetical protein
MGVGAPSMEADPGSQQQLEQMSAVPGAGAQAPMEGEPAIPSGRQAADGSGQEFAAASPMTIAVDEVYVNEPAGDGSEIERAAIAEAGPNPLVVGGLLVAALALGLLIVSWIARRRFADPLLR